MNFKTTVVLIVLLAVVGIFLYFSREQGTKPEVTEETEKKLIDIAVTDVTKLSITPADGKKIVLEKAGVLWQMIEPVKGSADTFEVDSLIRAITDLQSRGTTKVTAEKATATGLDRPRFKVELTAGGKDYQLNVGEKSVVGDNVYVSLGDSKDASVVAGDLYDKLEKPADTYRDKRLSNINANDVQQVVVTRPEMKLSLQRVGEDWQMTEPAKMPADKTEVDNLIFAIAGLKAEEFVSEGGDTKAYALDEPRMSVFISKDAPSTQPATQPATQATTSAATQPSGLTVKFGRFENVMKKSVMAMTSQSQAIVKVPATVLDTLTKKPLELRDKRAAKIDPTQVSKIRITSDLAATTQPTSRPASKSEIALIRRKEVPATAPATQAATAPAATQATQPSTTQSTTGPATAPSTTQAATQPVEPPSRWQFADDEKTNVDDGKVGTLLGSLEPLTVTKYLEARPTTQPSSTYTLSITTEGPGGVAPVQHEIRLTEISSDQPLVGDYNGLTFEVDRSLVTKLQGDFKKSSAAPAGPPLDEAFPQTPRP